MIRQEQIGACDVRSRLEWPRLAAVALAIVFALPVPRAAAQTVTGTILGTVRDTTGAVLANVNVVVTHVSTNISHRIIADDRGNYVVPLLKPGQYEVSASLPGFKTAVQGGITLEVEQRARVDMTLEVGQVTERLEVQANAPVISTESASVGQVIDNRKVLGLPLNGRNFIQLTYLAPGAVRGVGTNADIFGLGGSVSVNGGRVQNNNFLVDGTDNNGLIFGGFGLNLSVETIQEFKVQNNSYSAEFGRAGGAQINMTTRSGTNEFHGNLFEFMRNDAVDARNFFARGNPPLKRNQFGGTLGGPLTLPGLYQGKNRTFFFVSYEGLRLRRGAAVSAITPTAAQREGDFSGGPAILDPDTRAPFPGNAIPAARLDPIARKILDQFYALPNLSTAAPNYSSSFSNTDDSSQYTIRLDHRISDKDSLFGRYSLQDGRRFAPSIFNNFGNATEFFRTNISLNHVHLFDARKINEFRFGFNRPSGTLAQNETFGRDLITPLGIQGILPVSTPQFVSMPGISIAGFAGVGPGYYSPIADFPNFFSYIDNFVYIRGNHTIKAGAEIKRSQQNNQTGIGINGTIDFTPAFTQGSALADFLLGLPTSSRIAAGDSREYLRSTSYYPYLLDDWKITPRLTINLGVRYEYNTPWVERQDRLAGFGVGPDLKLIPLVAGRNGVRRSIVRPDRNNWAPRFGFAYQPFGNTKTVLRGGYGIFNSQAITNAQFLLRINPPFMSERILNSNAAERVLSLRDPFPKGVGAATQAGSNLDPNFVDGYVQQWSLNVQREIAPETALEIGYVGSKGTHLNGVFALNQAIPGTAPIQSRRPDPLYGQLTHVGSFASSRYDALQVRVERRFHQGLTFLAGYTFGKSIDDASSQQSGIPQNTYNLRAERGRSQFDVGQVFTFSYVWELPFGRGKHWLNASRSLDLFFGGWQLSGITTLQTGNPFSVGVSGDNSRSGTGADRANRIGKGKLPRSERTIDRYFDTSAFSMPAPLTFGNAGRNILSGPGLNNFDVALMKNFRFGERRWIEFRAESFNIANHPNFGMPGATVNVPASFGRIFSAQDPRIMQFGMKLYF